MKEEGQRDIQLFPPAPSPLQLWRSIMDSVEWNKKEELVAEQALKHLKVRMRGRERMEEGESLYLYLHLYPLGPQCTVSALL